MGTDFRREFLNKGPNSGEKCLENCYIYISMKKVALIQGGLGAEKEISYITGKAFAGALEKLSHPFEIIEADEKLPLSLGESDADMALLAVHGKYAEDGIVQAFCEYLKMPYTGCGVLASALCMDKVFSKQIWNQNRISTPGFVVVDTQQEDLSTLTPPFQLPLVTKPSREGSSVGVHVVRRARDFNDSLKDSAQYDRVILIEEFIEGIEVAVPVLQGRPLTVIEIVPKTGFFNYRNKYTKGYTDYYLPARLDTKILETCQEFAIKACESCHVRAYARVDLIVSQSGRPYVLEVNTLPGFTPVSLFPMSAGYGGITFVELIKILIENADLDYAGVR